MVLSVSHDMLIETDELCTQMTKATYYKETR